jgi:hypothetical protein
MQVPAIQGAVIGQPMFAVCNPGLAVLYAQARRHGYQAQPSGSAPSSPSMASCFVRSTLESRRATFTRCSAAEYQKSSRAYGPGICTVRFGSLG